MSNVEKLKLAAEKLGVFLTSFQLDQFELYYRELIEWNQRVNLTSITDYTGVQLKHFLDSLTVAAAIKNIKKNLKMADIGTGAGLPGIPLKIVFSDIHLALIEATLKKTRFLDQLISKLNLKNVEIIRERAETVAHDTRYRERFDIVVSRAVAALPALAEIMLPFCNIGGCCIAQKKGDIGREVEQSKKAIEVMGGSLREIKSIDLVELNDNRCLVIIDKIQPTPSPYPRRPGIPDKRPVIS
ncbi:MAG: 16S rRNA (guanine(527)-N(7))-methyltransferase [Chloroflexi bacterium RBG_13_51_18]|nr:MAG: 16S rRNA (guanine(527)-N(7))-methyltransferase [Chloroflexi bacterium RBG_13_51_18]